MANFFWVGGGGRRLHVGGEGHLWCCSAGRRHRRRGVWMLLDRQPHRFGPGRGWDAAAAGPAAEEKGEEDSEDDKKHLSFTSSKLVINI